MHSKTLTIALVIVLITSLLGPLGWGVGAQPTPTPEPPPPPPPLEEQIEASIVAGLQWLAGQQAGDGSWGDGPCDRVAATGLVVLKFEDRARELGIDPLDEEYEYFSQVSSGLAFIMANAHPQPIGVQPAGDPDGDGDGIGVYFTDCGGHIMYQTGIAAMALSASTHPELYGDMVQDATDFLAWAQADVGCGAHRGGWRYNPNQCSSDNSNSGYVALGVAFAEAFGATVPQFVKDELSIWIDVIQDDVDGDPDDGGSWYDPGSPWVNILKTGNLLHEMAFVSDPIDTQRVQDAVDYIERHWSDAGGCGTGWEGHRQAMFTMMKGLEAYNILLLDLDDDGIPEHDWFAEVAQHLIDTQNADGSWAWDCWSDQVLSTAWALLTLERVIHNRPPDCSGAYASVETIWPPNHKFVPVEVLGVVDPDEDELTITILGIWQDEPVDTYGDGTFTPDGIIAEDKSSCEVRAERSGTKKVPGDGRVYHIRFLAEDGRGGECVGKVRVCVPHDQSGDPCIDSGPPYYDSTATAP